MTDSTHIFNTPQNNLDADILLLDDHSVLLESMRDALAQAGYTHIQTKTTIAQAKEHLRHTPPHLLITDINLPDGSGLALAREVKRYLPEVKVLFLTMHDDAKTLEEAIATEAEGFVNKTTSLSGVFRAISSLLDGASVYPAGHKPSKYRQQPEASPPTLTHREESVLACLGVGLSNKEIARELEVAEGTVKVHIKTILKKLRVNNRTQAAIYAYENGYSTDIA